MRLLLKFLKVLAISAACLAGLVSAAALAVLWRPEWVLNSGTLGRLAAVAGRFGYAVQWRSLRTDVKSHGLLRKSVDLDFAGLCVAMPGNALQGCFGRLRVAGEFEWRRGFQVRSLGPLRVEGGSLRVLLDDAAPEPDPSAGAEWRWPEMLRRTRLGEVDLQFASLAVRRGESLVSGTLRLNAAPNPGAESARVTLGGEAICAESRAPVFSGCLELLAAEAELGWRDGPLRLLALGPVRIAGKELALTLPEDARADPARSRSAFRVPELRLPPELRDTRFSAASLRLPKLRIRSGGRELDASLNLALEPDEVGALALVKAEAEMAGMPGAEKIGGEWNLASPTGFRANDWNLSGTINLAGHARRLEAKAAVAPRAPEGLSVSIDARFREGKAAGELQGRGEWRPERIRAAFSGKARGFHSKVHEIALRDCAADFRQTRADGFGKLALDCPVRVDLTPMTLPSAAYGRQITLPHNFDLTVKTDLEAALDVSLRRPVSGTLEVILAPLSQDLVRLRGRTLTRFSGVPRQYPGGWNLRSEVELFAELPQFRRLAQALHRTAYPVPAPLEVLDGSVELGISGVADLGRRRGEFPVVFRTRLQSEGQGLDSEGSGKFRYALADGKNQGRLDLDLVLTRMKLALPRLGLASIPELLPDSRMRKPWLKPGKPVAGDLKYRVTVKTPPESPALVSSNLAQADIPIHLDLLLEEGKAGGTVRVAETPLRFFRREAQVRELKLTLADPAERSRVSGTIRVPYVDYKIDVLLVGTVERPRILFQSSPPLSQEQILSYLIYGREFEELDTEKTDSVGNVAAALSDRAVALGSLFLLASTPIQSLSYNPATQNFSAKIRLAEGTSLTVGTSEGKTQQVGIRKNVGGNWIVNTYIENDSEQGEQRGGAFLEYYKRY
ncbi:MAG: translocation/assembly module TamB domain-containing protein [Deltaproteobacteria bacterium]|nr:translocation/assembly module TamB domain-containing protein [Deltaproteobacteria bacterium]